MRASLAGLGFALCLALPVVAAAQGASGESGGMGDTGGWDQARALGLARELEHTLEAVLAAAEQALPQDTAMQQRTRDAAVAEMGDAYEASRELTTKLRLGLGRDATAWRFARVRDRYQHALRTGDAAVPRAAVAVQLARAEELLARLGALYGEG